MKRNVVLIIALLASSGALAPTPSVRRVRIDSPAAIAAKPIPIRGLQERVVRCILVDAMI